MNQETSKDTTFFVKDKTCRNEEFHWRESPILRNLNVTRFQTTCWKCNKPGLRLYKQVSAKVYET